MTALLSAPQCVKVTHTPSGVGIQRSGGRWIGVAIKRDGTKGTCTLYVAPGRGDVDNIAYRRLVKQAVENALPSFLSREAELIEQRQVKVPQPNALGRTTSCTTPLGPPS